MPSNRAIRTPVLGLFVSYTASLGGERCRGAQVEGRRQLVGVISPSIWLAGIVPRLSGVVALYPVSRPTGLAATSWYVSVFDLT